MKCSQFCEQMIGCHRRSALDFKMTLVEDKPRKVVPHIPDYQATEILAWGHLVARYSPMCVLRLPC